MFGVQFFNLNGKDIYSTPEKFTKNARKEINNHLKNSSQSKKLQNQRLKYINSSPLSTRRPINSNDLNDNNNDNIINNNNNNSITSRLKIFNAPHVPSKLSQQIATTSSTSTVDDDCMSISSEKSINSVNSQTSTGSNNSSKKKLFKFLTRSKSNDSTNSLNSNSNLSINSRSQQQQSQQHNHINQQGYNTSVSIPLERLPTNHSQFTTSTSMSTNTGSATLENSSSIFSTNLRQIYTNSTTPTFNTSSSVNNTMNNNNSTSGLLPEGYITLEDALPRDYSDMYSSDLTAQRFSNGRPIFTKRNLSNWELNDIRSLLIITELRSEWGNKLPIIISKNYYTNIKFNFIYLPLNSTDDEFIKILSNSDLYKESKFDLNFKIKTATHIIKNSRLRHANYLINNYNIPNNYFKEDGNLINSENDENIKIYNNFLKYEWRNIIENYLLNLAVESQCRLEFKFRCSNLKKDRLKLLDNISNNNSNNNNISNNVKNPLLSQAILNNSHQISGGLLSNSIKLTTDEKNNIWNDVQKTVCNRLELDWSPDNHGTRNNQQQNQQQYQQQYQQQQQQVQQV
ncbi:hypothetical protein B5S32_g5523 [[Candida] boidinii]|nr:hypothetical protein B5S32_g5523 [[Candida] boidinii]